MPLSCNVEQSFKNS